MAVVYKQNATFLLSFLNKVANCRVRSNNNNKNQTNKRLLQGQQGPSVQLPRPIQYVPEAGVFSKVIEI